MAFIIGIALFLVGCQNKEDVEGNWLENVSTPSKENTELILRHAIDSEEKINQLRDVVNAVQSNKIGRAHV